MIEVLTVLIVLLNIADYLTTKAVLKAGGREANPVMRWCIERNLLIPAKILLTIIPVVCLLTGYPKHPVVFGILGWLMVAFYCFVIINNVRQLNLLKENKCSTTGK